ncbi:MAG: hypothetical protein OEQ53_17480, partial [Saprospiraceae bacterium]|nr:hypothetical protein [Saprospiraceae bacterium]
LMAQFDSHSLKVRWSSPLDVVELGIESGYELKLFRDEELRKIPIKTFLIQPASEENIEKQIENEADSLTYSFFDEMRKGSFQRSDPEKGQWQLLAFLFGLQENFDLAKELGLGFEIFDLDANQVFSLELSVPGTSDSEHLVATSSRIKYQEVDLPIPRSPVVTCDNNRTTITGIINDTATVYGSYRIETRHINAENFTPVNDLPLLVNYQKGIPKIYLIDTLSILEPSEYRIVGKDIWGRWGPPSAGTLIEPCHITFLPPNLLVAEEVEQRGIVQLKWTLPDSLVRYAKGFSVYRSNNKFEGYKKIHDQDLLAPSQFSYLDKNPMPISFYYIRVQYDKNIRHRSLSRMVALMDTRPPSVPEEVMIKFDTVEFTTELSWSEVSSPDLNGYRIYFSHHKLGEKFLLTNLDIPLAHYIDPIDPAVLYERKYYWITSRDVHQNESFYSDSVYVEFPDRFAPIAPRITDVRYDYGHSDITWEKSPSKDVLLHIVQRKKESSPDWEKIPTINVANKNVFRDTLLLPGDTALYRIIAFDSTGLSTISNTRTGWRLEGILLPEIEYFKAELHDAAVVLFFDYNDSIPIEKFKIIAGQTSHDLKTIAHVQPAQSRIRSSMIKTDTRGLYSLYKWAVSDTTYRFFQLQVIGKNRKPSPLTAIFEAK